MWRGLLPWAQRSLPFVVLFVVLWWVMAQRQDADFGWHYRTGEYILKHGVPLRDIFTYTATDFHWINHEWLHDVVIYGGTRYGQYGWVAGVFAAVWVLALGLMSRWRLSWGVGGVALAALLPYVGVRPVAWTALGLAGLWWVLKNERFWALPPLFLVWANLHGGFSLGLVVTVIYGVMTKSWRAGAWLAVAIGGTLVNPYGWGVYLEIVRTLGDQHLRSTIVEWMPLAVTYGNAPYLLAVILAVGLMAAWPWWERMVGGMLVVMAIGATRQLPLLVIATLGLVQAGYGVAVAWWRKQHRSEWWIWVAGMTGVLVGVTALAAPPDDGKARGMVVPYRSAQILRQEPCRGRIFNHYSFGGYLIGRVPGVPVYIDGRMPSWSGREGRYLDRWQRVMNDPDYARREFERYDVVCVLITRDDVILSQYLETAGWRRVMTEATGVLWRRD